MHEDEEHNGRQILVAASPPSGRFLFVKHSQIQHATIKNQKRLKLKHRLPAKSDIHI